MSPAARSVQVFGVYLLVLALVLLVAPNLLLTTFFLPPTSEVWIRVVGMLVGIIGFYYRVAAAAELRQIFVASVYARVAVLVFFGIFVAASWALPALLPFGVIDVLGAAWTWSALRRDA